MDMIHQILLNHPKWAAAFATPLLFGLGYLYRSRRESKRNLRAALYALMEVWHRLAVFYRTDFRDVYDATVEELREQVPDVNLDEGEIAAAKDHFAPILERVARHQALSDLEGFEEQYAHAVAAISSERPILAYQINSASKTRKFLRFLESYLESSLKPLRDEGGTAQQFADELSDELMKYGPADRLRDLEKDIYRLARKISILTSIQARVAVARRKKQVQEIDRSEVQYLVTNVLLPVMERLNKEMQATAESGA